MEDGSFQLKKGVRKSIITFPKKQNIPKYHGEHLPSRLHFTHGNKKLAMSLKQILKRFKMSELL